MTDEPEPVNSGGLSVRVLPEVANALERGLPVVALETTILSHGLPWPVNEEVGRACEVAVRESGAVPATLGVRDGEILVGLGGEGLRSFCDGRRPTAKVNPSNFAAVVASGGDGSLTVGACLMVCSRLGIRAFATGGIGGVHRGWAHLPDVSADLAMLSRHRVVTVSAGAKSILDLDATLEALESLGVPVLGWGTSEFAEFHARGGGRRVDWRVDSPSMAARVARAHWELGGAGLLVAVPVPAEAAMAAEELAGLVDRALAAANAAGVSGRTVTPFVLGWLAENSGGACLRANRMLVEQNALVAGQIAAALASGTDG